MKKKFKILYIDSFTSNVKLGYDKVLDLNCFVHAYDETPINKEFDSIEAAEECLSEFINSDDFKKFRGDFIIQPIYCKE